MGRGTRALAILFATFALAGAAGWTILHGDQANPSGAVGEACSLLTKDDAAAALGEAVTGPKSSSRRSAAGGADASSCEFEGSGIHNVRLNLMHFTPDMAAMYRAMCEQKSKEGLSGLGDVACWYNEKHQELQVLKGTTFFSIELRRSGNPTEAITAVAKKAFARMK